MFCRTRWVSALIPPWTRVPVEAGDIIIPIQEGVIDEDHIRAELGEVVAGLKPGRESDDEITVFKSVGLAIQDVASAVKVYQLAQQEGVGQEVEL